MITDKKEEEGRGETSRNEFPFENKISKIQKFSNRIRKNLKIMPEACSRRKKKLLTSLKNTYITYVLAKGSGV